jgi:protein-disulfide isomerase
MTKIMKFCLVLVVSLAGVAANAQESSHVHKDGEDGHNHAPAPAAEPVPHIHGDIVYGNADAPVEVIEYGSMTCGHCKHFYDEVLKELQKDLIPSGKVKLVFRNFVRDRADMAIAILSRCATDLDQAKRLIGAYFDRQPEWIQSQQIGLAIQSIANTNGVTFDRLQACTTSQEIANHLVEMRQAGVNAYQIKATPTVIVNGVKAEFKTFPELLEKIELATLGK